VGGYLKIKHLQHLEKLVQKILEIAKEENKLAGFSIGNTAKMDLNGFYYTPIRNTAIMVTGGIIVYSEKQAIDITRYVDGKVQYILVDAEKKIPNTMSLSGEPANIERAVRETIQKSRLWIYKGNDLSVEAVDNLLSYLTKDGLRGIGGKRIAILGAGNIGSKLALKLVERGAEVVMTRRDEIKLKSIARALNYIKPAYTTAEITCTTDNEKAAMGAEILIGATSNPIISKGMIKNLAKKSLVVDVGKGALQPEAIQVAEEMGITIYRLDVSAAFEGIIHRLWTIENALNNKLGRRLFKGEPIVSGGLLGRKNEIVVDNVFHPKEIFGIANGRGDFVRDLSEEQTMRIEKLQEQV
jgi:hypothetical protein